MRAKSSSLTSLDNATKALFDEVDAEPLPKSSSLRGPGSAPGAP